MLQRNPGNDREVFKRLNMRKYIINILLNAYASFFILCLYILFICFNVICVIDAIFKHVRKLCSYQAIVIYS